MFALTHAFKMFDKDQSNSIDKDEMRAVTQLHNSQQVVA